MNEVLKHRLMGAVVLLALALLLTFVLPRPQAKPELEPGLQTAIIDLRVPAPPQESPAVEPASQPLPTTPLPQEIAAVEPEPLPESAVTEPQPKATEPVPEPIEVAKAEQKSAQKAEPEPKAEPKPEIKSPPPPVAPQKPEPKPAQLPAAGVPEQKLTSPPVASGDWFVQAGAFGDINNARQLLDKLAKAGLSGMVSPTETASGVLYRARLGPYSDRPAAEAARTKALELGVGNASVVAAGN